MSTTVRSIPPEQRANLTTAEWIAEHDERARMAVALAESERKRAALAEVLAMFEVAADQAAEFLSDEPCTGAWAISHAESLAQFAMEARAALRANAEGAK